MSDLGEIAVPQAWKLPGVGIYGTDVDVVSLETYQALAQRCRNAEAAALMWARKVAALEHGNAPTLMDGEVLEALRLPANALAPIEASGE